MRASSTLIGDALERLGRLRPPACPTESTIDGRWRSDRLGHDLDRAAEFARHEAGLDAHAGDLARQALADLPRWIQGLAAEAVEAGDEDDRSAW